MTREARPPDPAQRNTDMEADSSPSAPRGLGKRHQHVLLLFMAIALAYGIRINLSVAIVSMADKGRHDDYEVFDWGQGMRGTILSSFFWGYVLMQVPGSILAQRFGPRRFLLAAVSSASLLAILTPWLVRAAGLPALISIRVLQGLLSGLVFPSSHNMLGRWTPPLERPRFASLVYGGMSLGTVAAMAGAGELCSSSLGWPSAFYVPGAMGLAWCVLWWFLSADTPAQCKGISPEELAYIECSLGSSASKTKSVASVPWRSILTSAPALSIVVVHCGQNFGHWMLLTEIPNYMQTALDFDIEGNGFVSSLPYVSLWLASFLVGWAAQRINERRLIPLTASRKIFNSCAHWGAGLTLLLLALVRPNKAGAIAMLTVAVTLESCIFAGFYVSHMDLSPNYGGALMGLSNGCGSVMGIIAPILVGHMLGNEAKVPVSCWNNVFILTACIYFTGNLVYVLLCRAEVQPWNEPACDRDERETGVTLRSHRASDYKSETSH